MAEKKYFKLIPHLDAAWLSDDSIIGELRELGVKKKEIKRLAGFPERHKTNTQLFGREVLVNSPFWYLHGLKEIFIDRTYAFHSDTFTPRIIDCGANIGLSILFFKSIYPEARIIAFEPDADIFRILNQNLSNFYLTDVEVINKAVWMNNKGVRFHQDGGVGGSIDLHEDAEFSQAITPSARLKDFLAEPVDFLKIDIEGAETTVLEDCAEDLHSVRQLFIEYHSHPETAQTLDKILLILRKNGFRYYIKEAWENMKHPFLEKRGIYYDLQLNIFAYRK